MSTFSNLYLGSEPVSVSTDADDLLITLADERTLAIPLHVVSEIAHRDPLSDDARVLVLRRPPQIDHVHVSDSTLGVYLKDGRVLSCPLAWFPRLLHGTPAEHNHYELCGDDDTVHWPDLDEDIELVSLLEGGKSTESERSIQRWLSQRQAQLELNAASRTGKATY